ncbi:hypothetical protein [Putridiphycobacter roseus]|nr:hypothetical protein [Putridiphycobacter roseus]
MFQDPNTEFGLTSGPNVLANYAKLRAGEFGLMYRRKFDNKISWGVGIGSRFDHYTADIAVIDVYYDQYGYEHRESLDAHFLNIQVNKANLRFQFAYDLTERIGLGLNLNIYDAYVSTPNFSGRISTGQSSKATYFSGDSTWTEFNYSYNLNINASGGSTTIVPELFVTAELLKGLNFITGAKLGLMGKNNRYFDMVVEGVFRPESKIYESAILHESAITAQDFSYFMGFTYDLQLQRKNKK